MTTTCNHSELVSLSNQTFVGGSVRGNRATIAKNLVKCINFNGGYRAAYREVGKGYVACDSCWGPSPQGYVANSKYE